MFKYRKSDKNKLTIMLKPNARLQTMTKEPAKFQINRYKTA